MSEHLSPEEILQSILQNVQIGGNLTTGDITQILNLIVVIKQIDSFKPTEIPQNVPRSGTIKFVGRAEALERLHQMLQQNNQIVLAAIEGMGGVGKTELATQYALIHLLVSTYTGGICWLRARDEDIGLQIVQFAMTDLGLQPPDNLDLQQQTRWCWSRWYQGNVLVVLDDVNDYQKVEPYLPPQSPRFKVLITTRLQLDDLTESSRFILDVLSESAAIELLEGWIEASKIKQELADAKELCQWLGYLPLALNLVGRYVKKRKLSLAEMLRRLKEKKLSHESLVRDSNDRTLALNIKRGVEAAFELSWEELSKDAQKLGCLLSLFALAPFPWSLVESAAPEQDAEELEDARVELENLHLLMGEDSYQLHPLIQEFLRDKQNNLAVKEEQKYNYCVAMVAVAEKIPQSLILQEITTSTIVIPHLAEVATVYNNWLSDEDLIMPFRALSRFFQGQGAYAQALPWLEQCLSVAKNRLGEEHPHVATSYNNLGVLYCEQGLYNEAELLYKKALELRLHLLGEEHPHVTTSYNNLAAVYQSLGRYNEAEPLYIKALELRLRRGEEHPDVATTFNNLANLYRGQKRYSEAEPLYRKALELRLRRGEEHPNVAETYNNLAGLYSDQDRYSEAEPLFIKALELYQHLLGEEHPNVATTYNNLAAVYSDQKRYSEAEPLYRKALELRQRLLGEKHPQIATTYNNLANLYRDQERYSEAQLLYQKALKIAELSLGVDHDITKLIRENMTENMTFLADNDA
ncbi:MAG: tetratricopeptide repeat protein [Brasilonema angustatum HA4187-MV1]|jgi:tetratricopeptide (TPR) repeat protein|nr:tetratricopeptide repeat protein [Brasilonema angustatum HA4187-MV1]